MDNFSYKDFQFLEEEGQTPNDAFDTELKMYAFSDHSRARIMGHNKVNKFGLTVKGIDIIFNTEKDFKMCLFLNANEFPEVYETLDVNSIFKNWIVYDYLTSSKIKNEETKDQKDKIEQAYNNLKGLFDGKKETVSAEDILGKELFDKVVKIDKQYVVDNQERYREGYDAVEFGANNDNSFL